MLAALVPRNAKGVQTRLQDAIEAGDNAWKTRHQVGPVLLRRLLGPHAVALNRAAAADGSGKLGAALAREGRDAVLPLISDVFDAARKTGELKCASANSAARLYIDLLIRDWQIRRVAAHVPSPSAEEIALRSKRAAEHLFLLIEHSDDHPKKSPAR